MKSLTQYIHLYTIWLKRFVPSNVELTVNEFMCSYFHWRSARAQVELLRVSHISLSWIAKKDRQLLFSIIDVLYWGDYLPATWKFKVIDCNGVFFSSSSLRTCKKYIFYILYQMQIKLTKNETKLNASLRSLFSHIFYTSRYITASLIIQLSI